MKLHTYFRSSCSYRVRIALALKGIQYESVPVHLRRGEQRGEAHLARNPQGLVPVLDEGDRWIGQSLAILEYLEELHPDPPLLPAEPAERAWVRQLALVVACEIQPLQNLSVLARLEREFGCSEAGRRMWVRGVIEDGLRTFEATLTQGNSSGRCCYGDQPTLADICLIPQVYNALRFECDLAGFPTLLRIYHHCDALPPFRAAAPENQPDAE